MLSKISGVMHYKSWGHKVENFQQKRLWVLEISILPPNSPKTGMGIFGLQML